ncbi:MAG TPA: alpha-hydroxy acid oxidase [Rhizomicrobium sp.]|jgi:L-lactate dehydrogenase (cytochrome)|nr:alpha-hydroxy acid oxidase [Rhizomicrobium sp.]
MSLASPRVVNIKDLRRLARVRLPDAVFDYLDGAADDEVTLKDSEKCFREVLFKPRFAVATPACDLGVTVLGHKLDLPFMLGPIGYSRLMHPRGELAASAAAGRHGTAYILSTMSGHRIEDVKAQSQGPTFYQLYLAGGRGAAEGAIARAKAAGYKALFVTIDTPVAGNRERDVRNGMKELMGANPLKKLRYIPNILAHPRWLAAFIADGMSRPFPNIVVPGSGPLAAVDVAAALESAQVSWTDLKWIRDVWDGPIVMKGVMTVDDARRSVDHGAQGIVVSTHAGRQLDGCAASLRVLPGIVEAVGDKTEVIFDGGIRRGADIVRAIAMGAKAVLLGRGYAYGMAAGGDAGIERAIEIFRADIVRTLKLLGCTSISQLDRSYIALRPGFRVD